MRARPCKYRGVVFRSTLEARWAEVFDRIEVPWVYEPEGFDLGGNKYLPDFYIWRWDAWVEIKPNGGVTKAAETKLRKLRSVVPGKILLLHGDLWYFDDLPQFEAVCSYQDGRSFKVIQGELTRIEDRYAVYSADPEGVLILDSRQVEGLWCPPAEVDIYDAVMGE